VISGLPKVIISWLKNFEYSFHFLH
jgi:hypothetical protein